MTSNVFQFVPFKKVGTVISPKVSGDSLTLSGSLSLPIVTKVYADSPYTVTALNHTILCNAVSGNMTINLPTAVGISGRIYNIKKIDTGTNTVTIDANGSETIDGYLTVVISDKSNICIQSDGSNWQVI